MKRTGTVLALGAALSGGAFAQQIQILGFNEQSRTIDADQVSIGGMTVALCVVMSPVGNYSATLTGTPYAPYDPTLSEGYTATLRNGAFSGPSISIDIVDQMDIVTGNGFVSRESASACDDIFGSPSLSIQDHGLPSSQSEMRTAGSVTANISITVAPD